MQQLRAIIRVKLGRVPGTKHSNRPLTTEPCLFAYFVCVGEHAPMYAYRIDPHSGTNAKPNRWSNLITVYTCNI